MQFLKVTAGGRNRKLGNGVTSTYRPLGKTCPPSCGMTKLCYGSRGFVRIHADKSLTCNDSLDKAGERRYLRHCVTGDAFLDGKLDCVYVQYLIDWHTENSHVIGWLYTHDIAAWDAEGFTVDKMPANLHVTASVDSEKQRQYAASNGWRYARVTKVHDEELKGGESFCPYDLEALTTPVDDISVTCKSCKKCFSGTDSIVFHLQIPDGGRKTKERKKRNKQK